MTRPFVAAPGPIPKGPAKDIVMMELSAGTLAAKDDPSGGRRRMLAISPGAIAKPRALLRDGPPLAPAPILGGEGRPIIKSAPDRLWAAAAFVAPGADLTLAVADRSDAVRTRRIDASGRIEKPPIVKLVLETYLGERQGDKPAGQGARRTP